MTLAAILGLAGAGRVASAQTVLDRTPNLAGAWVGPPGVLHFNFLHRFSSSPAPERKVTSAPTFLLAAGLPHRTLLGVHYASNSELSARYPNEWEIFGRYAPLDQELGAPLDASIQVGYNLAGEGPDGEVAVARRQGPVRVLGAVRMLSAPNNIGGADVALAGGASLRLKRGIALAGDVTSLVDRAAGERVAWSAGVSLAIPHTPHTLSLHAHQHQQRDAPELVSRDPGDPLRVRVHHPGDAEPVFRRAARRLSPRRGRMPRRPGRIRSRRQCRTSCSAPPVSRSRRARR